MPGRVSVTIDGKKFNAIEAVFAMGTQKDPAGMPVLQTLNTAVHLRVDLNDDKNIPFDTIKSMFELGNVPDRSKLKTMKIEFWKDDTMQDVICAYNFKGWISMFRVTNNGVNSSTNGYNHVMEMELTPIINKENYQEVKISN
jgi:hypothetical protein